MVTNIQQTNEELTLTTNARVLQMNMKAYVPGWGEYGLIQQPWQTFSVMLKWAIDTLSHMTATKKMCLLCICCTNKLSLHERTDYMSIGHPM
jgi:hypothetical protein